MSTNSNLVTSPTLLGGLQKMDPASWGEFVKLYEPLLRAYVAHCIRRYNLGLQEDDRDDIRQNVLMKLWKTIPSFTLDHQGKGRFRTWLWRVTHNSTIDFVRRTGREPKASGGGVGPDGGEDFPPVAGPDPEPPTTLLEEHDWEMRRQILAQVKEETQASRKWDCFEQHYLLKRPSAEVATELGMSVSAVNTYTSRVLARIRELCRYKEVEL